MRGPDFPHMQKHYEGFQVLSPLLVSLGSVEDDYQDTNRDKTLLFLSVYTPEKAYFMPDIGGSLEYLMGQVQDDIKKEFDNQVSRVFISLAFILLSTSRPHQRPLSARGTPW